MVSSADARRELARRELERRQSAGGQSGNPLADMGDMTARFDAEPSEVRRSMAQDQYGRLSGWQKPIVAADDVLTAVANGATFGWADKAVAGARSAFTDKSYEQELADRRAKTQEARDRAPGAYAVGEAAGGIRSAVNLAGRGLTATRLANGATPGLNRLWATMAGSAVDGAALGAVTALGNDTDVAAGVGTGAVIGGLAPAAFAALRTAFAPIFSRMRPDQAANSALETLVARSGKSQQQIVSELNAATREGQDVFTMADALGNPGQRMLSTIARTPNDGRRQVVEALENRQAGQGERLSNFVARSLNAPDTAAQRTAALRAERSQTADHNYANARQGAGPVDVSRAIGAADEFISPGVNRVANPGSQIADDSVEGAVRRARSLLTDGRSNITDFSTTLRAKQEIQDSLDAAMRGGRGNQARLLGQINRQLDEALERASPGYRTANDTFRQQSRTIDAVDAGRAATSGRTRATDNIREFRGMRGGEQNAFRSGYSDPIIAKIESSAPGVNKARALMNDKTAQELREFSIPNRAPRLQRQIGREQTMFETRAQALGGSKTADNLADQAEMSLFDPSVLGNLLSGNIGSAAASAGRQSLANLQGLAPSVRTRLATMLLQRDPSRATGQIAAAIRQGRQLNEREIRMVRMLMLGGVAGAQAAQR